MAYKYKVGDDVRVTEAFFVKQKVPPNQYKGLVVNGYVLGKVVGHPASKFYDVQIAQGLKYEVSTYFLEEVSDEEEEASLDPQSEQNTEEIEEEVEVKKKRGRPPKKPAEIPQYPSTW